MARKLDRSRPFNTSYGETNLRFHQDGRYFNALGLEVDLNGNVIPDPPPASPVPAPAAPPPPVAPAVADTAPIDDEGGVSVDQALGAEPTVEPAAAEVAAADPKAAEPRAILENMTLEELRMLGKRANAPADLIEAKGKEARDPLVTWLVEHGT